jgi:hypothetical protein
MKKLDRVLVLFISLFSIALIVVLLQNVFYFAVLDMEVIDVNFGVVQPNAKTCQSVKFYNRGNKTLVIDKVVAGCGCTEVKLSKRSLRPKEEGNIEIILTGKYMPGNSHADIHFFSNDKSYPIKKMTVHYTSVSEFFFSPKQLDFGLIQKSDLPVKKKIKIVEPHSVPSEKKEPLSVSLDVDFFNANIVHGEDKTRSIEVDVLSDVPLGNFFESLCVINSNEQKSYFADVVGVVRGAVYANPPVIDFGDVIVEEGFFEPDKYKERITVLSRKKDLCVQIQKVVVCETLCNFISYHHDLKNTNSITFYVSPQTFSSEFADKEIRGRVSIFCSDTEGEDFILNVPLRFIAKKFRMKDY